MALVAMVYPPALQTTLAEINSESGSGSASGSKVCDGLGAGKCRNETAHWLSLARQRPLPSDVLRSKFEVLSSGSVRG